MSKPPMAEAACRRLALSLVQGASGLIALRLKDLHGTSRPIAVSVSTFACVAIDLNWEEAGGRAGGRIS